MLIQNEKRITLDFNMGEANPTLIFREPTPQELRSFLKSRFIRKGSKVDDQTLEAREKFADMLLIGCENVEIQNGSEGPQPLTPQVADWKAKIPVNWKTSCAIRFEERETVSPEDEKN